MMCAVSGDGLQQLLSLPCELGSSACAQFPSAHGVEKGIQRRLSIFCMLPPKTLSMCTCSSAHELQPKETGSSQRGQAAADSHCPRRIRFASTLLLMTPANDHWPPQ